MHSNVRHQYAALCTQHVGLEKCMLTFTCGGRGRGVYTKLRLINEIKSYVTYLIANSKAEIYFFSVIEVGSELSNPHLHTQIWSDDIEAVRGIYDKVIAKFSLVKKRCKLTKPDQLSSIPTIGGYDYKNSQNKSTLIKPQQPHHFYNYVIKDYAKTLTDNEIWNLEQTKIRMRNHMGKKLRFISKSKGKYTQKMYKMVYYSFRVLRAFADKFLDFVTSSLFFKKEIIEDLLYSKKFVKSFFLSSFISIREQVFEDVCLKSYFLVLWVGLDILFFSPALDPPYFEVIYSFILKRRFIMFDIRLFMCFVWSSWCVVEARSNSPPVFDLGQGFFLAIDI